MSQALTTTDVTGLSPRAVDGAPIEQLYPRVVSILTTRLGPAYAALFGEPQRGVDGIAWASRASGSAKPLEGVGVARRAAVLSRIEGMCADIRSLADRMEHESRSNRGVSRTLRIMARIPFPQHVWLVDDQPVIVLWTHEAVAVPKIPAMHETAVMPALDGSAAVRGAARITPTASKAATESVVQERGWARSLAWIVPLLLLPVLGWLILQEPLWPSAGDAAWAARVAELRQNLAALSSVDTTACAARKSP